MVNLYVWMHGIPLMFEIILTSCDIVGVYGACEPGYPDNWQGSWWNSNDAHSATIRHFQTHSEYYPYKEDGEAGEKINIASLATE
jgi:hypothetical protein